MNGARLAPAKNQTVKRERVSLATAATRRRWRRATLGAIGLGVVAVLIVGTTVLDNRAGRSNPAASSAGVLVPPAVESEIANVRATELNNLNLPSIDLLSPPREFSGQPLLLLNGKPEILYMGALYCSQCAAERWPLAIALSRFGTFAGLREIFSAPKPEPFPRTPSLSFDGARYKSKYISFDSVEMQSDQRQPGLAQYAKLQTPTSEEVKLYDSFDISSNGKTGGVIPFIDYGNQFAQVEGANFSPGLLAGMTPVQVAAVLAKPESQVAQAILGSADVITAMICVTTDGEPSAVCNEKAVKMAFSGVLSSQQTS
jgi:Domain of unknown function (DUF929)